MRGASYASWVSAGEPGQYSGEPDDDFVMIPPKLIFVGVGVGPTGAPYVELESDPDYEDQLATEYDDSFPRSDHGYTVRFYPNLVVVTCETGVGDAHDPGMVTMTVHKAPWRDGFDWPAIWHMAEGLGDDGEESSDPEGDPAYGDALGLIAEAEARRLGGLP